MSTLDTLDLRAATRRTTRLFGANWKLLTRNTTTLMYAFAMPVFPLLFLFVGDEPDAMAGAAFISTMLVMALLFPGYYNMLSAFVTRRDELVLKRLRTGEIRDGELIVSMALPGAAITLAVLVLAVPVALVAGLELPLNPVLLLLGTLLAIVTFAAFAVWTAAWTKNAEAAQLTSGPVILIATVGLFAPALPERFQRYADLLPGTAVNDLVRAAWFGRNGDGGALSFADTWSQSLPALGVLVAWTVLAVVLASRSLTWEPRT